MIKNILFCESKEQKLSRAKHFVPKNFLLTMAAWSIFGCGHSEGPHRALNSADPGKAPLNGTAEILVYSDVQKILQARCSPCHNFGASYSNVYPLARGGHESLVYKYVVEKSPKEMPLKGSQQSQLMTNQERT